jgi:hypothetical protein
MSANTHHRPQGGAVTPENPVPTPNVGVPTHRRFVLARDEDVTGVSGTGVVAEGVWWSEADIVALRWTSDWPTSVVFHERGLASVEAVHGHGGRTRIVWLDKEGS